MRDQATIDFLARERRRIRSWAWYPDRAINGAHHRAGQLLRPYPQFTGVTSNATDGTTTYNSAQVKLEKRFTKGYMLLVGYTYSHFTERVFKAERDRHRLRGAPARCGRAAPALDQRHLGAAVWPGTTLGE